MCKNISLILITLISSLLFACSGGNECVSEDYPISELKAQTEKMDVAKLKKMASSVKDAITAKQSKIEALAKKLKAIPLTDMMGDDAKMIKSDIEAITKTIKILQERLQVYTALLEKHGVDISALK